MAIELIQYAEKKIRQWKEEQEKTDSRTQIWHNRQARIDGLYVLIDRLSRKETGGD